MIPLSIYTKMLKSIVITIGDYVSQIDIQHIMHGFLVNGHIYNTRQQENIRLTGSIRLTKSAKIP